MTVDVTKSIQPFLKWPGGKRWFIQQHATLFPKNFNCYIEPFLGGGSIFFHLKPTYALLGDINKDVIHTYQGIKENWEGVVRSLRYHERNHSDEYYYYLREKKPRNKISRASRMIYLNRTCFNGIYRVNLKGEFNVPRGSKNDVFLTSDNFEAISLLLNNAEIFHYDFKKLIDEAQKNDFVFADPPYTVRHNLNGFIKYNEQLFSWDDQIRLADSLFAAKKRGAHILLTNANHQSIQELYKDRGFNLISTSRFSSISALGKFRKQYEELIITSY